MTSKLPDPDSVTMSSRRRHVTILFSDICSSTLLGHSIDPEILAEIFHKVKIEAEKVVSKHGGIVNQFYGDGVLALFGISSPQEDDARRATQACIELHELINKISFENLLPSTYSIRLHSGIHSGLVLVSDGNSVNGKYEIIGDPINIAAGLCAAAEKNEIFVSARTLQGSLPFFETRQLPPLSLKGKPSAIPTYQILGRSEVKTRYEARTRLGLTAFVGRKDQLLQLKNCLQVASEGNLQVASIVGDAGIGKSRLAAEFINQSQTVDCALYRGYCESYGSIAPLQPFLQILRQIFRLKREMSATESRKQIDDVLNKLDPELLIHRGNFFRILSLKENNSDNENGKKKLTQDSASQAELDNSKAISILFSRLSSQRPIILFIDDCQWADEASRSVLSNMIRTLENKSVFILKTSRKLDDYFPASGEIIIQLGPLGFDDSAQMYSLLPHGLNYGFKDKIHEHSGGNALFIEELCRSLCDWAPDKTRDEQVPATVHEMVESRIERLPNKLAALLRTAAIIGNVIPRWLLELVHSDDDLDSIILQLANNDLLYCAESEDTLHFKHGITRDVVYQSVRLRERQSLHLRIAQILEANSGNENNDEHYEILTHHYMGGADYSKAVRFAQLAGDKAIATSSLDRAREQYRTALAALEQTKPGAEVKTLWISISIRWAMPCVYGPERDQLYILHRAVEYARELNDPKGLALSLYWLGYLNYVLGEQVTAIDYYQQAMVVTQNYGDYKLRGQIQATMGQSYAAACAYSDALLHLDNAIEIKRQHPSKSNLAVGSAYAIACKSTVLADKGYFEEANTLIEKSLNIVSGYDHEIESSILNMYGIILLWQGKWEKCIENTQRAQTEGEGINTPYVFAGSRAMEAYARWKLLRDPDSLDLLLWSTQWLEKHDMQLYLSLYYGWAADVLVSIGREKDAYHYGLKAIRQVRKQDRLGEAMACRVMAKIWTKKKLAAGNKKADVPSAEHFLGQATESASVRNSRHEKAVNLLHLAEYYLSTESLAQKSKSKELLGQAQDEFAQMDMSWHLMQAEQLSDQIK